MQTQTAGTAVQLNRHTTVWTDYLGDDVQRTDVIVGVTFVRFPVSLPELIGADSLGWTLVLTHGDVAT